MENDETAKQETPLPVLDPDKLAEKLRLIEELCGCTAGGPSMCDMLLEERRREREMELAKDGW
jgi:hypothetical protein